jgi:capsular exopolysaccharide synthesis family protein
MSSDLSTPTNRSSEPGQKISGPSGGGGYSHYGNYGGYGVPGYGGYGAPGYGEPVAQRAFLDYILIIRERKWYIITVFLVIFSAVVAFTLSQTRLYQSIASIQVLRRESIIMQVQSVQDNDIRTAEDLNTQVKVLESMAIIEKVAAKLKGADLAAFTAPYLEPDSLSLSLTKIILANRKIVPARLSLVIVIQYTHPDPVVAALVANYFVEEYINYNSRMRVADSLRAVDDLKIPAELQKQKVEQMALALQIYREKNNLVSLDERKSIVTDKLKALNLYATQTNARRQDAQIRWNQIQEITAKRGDLLSLEFIGGQPNIMSLVQQLSLQQIVVAQLRERYREQHPKMVAAVNQLTTTSSELKRAVENASATIESAYQTALRNDTEARHSLASAEEESIRLDRYAVDYSNQARDYQINEKLLQSMVARMGETKMSSSMETQNARVLDYGALAKKPIYPNQPLNYALGVLGGLAIGLAFAFFVAYIDDRVKSSFDIESIVGLPLIGIIPYLSIESKNKKSQVVDNLLDKRAAEGFFALHAGLQLKDETKTARNFLITSTVPGEGKTFVATNLALTFASHGERTLLIDCDLRKPNIHKQLELENLRGVIDCCEGTAKLDEVIVKNFRPHLDVLPSGGRAKSPTQLLNSKAFEVFIAEIGKRYDRVIIDTPPLAAVTDALIVLPLMNVSLFCIYFNKVPRKSAQHCAQQLMNANVPCAGAILNGLNLAVSGYYYQQYYDQSYKEYFGESVGEKKQKIRN